MALAPDPRKLKSKTEEVAHMGRRQAGPTVTDITDTAPDGIVEWKLFGVGGAGKVAALRFATKSTKTTTTTIDTSGTTIEAPNIEAIRIKGLNGSGKLQMENVEPIRNFVSDYTASTKFHRINVIIMSFSGGSGSVIGPMLIDEILRQGKVAVVLGIIDTDSEVDTVNALKSLMNLEHVATSRNGYLPVVLFDNAVGRAIVDGDIDRQLENISSILDVPYDGLDKEDRIKFLNPSVFPGVTKGVRMLNMSRKPDGSWGEQSIIHDPDSFDRVDAALIISSRDENYALDTKCSVIFRGYHGNTQSQQLIASIGYHIPEKLISDLNAKIHAYRSAVTKSPAKIVSEYEIGNQVGGGLIF